MDKRENFQGKPIYTISRGVRCKLEAQQVIENLKKLGSIDFGTDKDKDKDKETQKKKSKLVSDKDKLLKDFQKLKDGLTESVSFSGASSAILFSVSKEIQLCGLSFFGPVPPSQKSENYQIWIGIGNMGGTMKNILNLKSVSVQSSSDENTFWIYFDKLIPLQPSDHIRVSFELAGPKTGILDSETMKTHVSGEDGTVFQFLSTSSKQIHKLAYCSGSG